MLIALFRLLSFFPLPLLHAIGAILGWVVYGLSPVYRRRLQQNIRQAGFKKHTLQAIVEIGKGMFELPFIWYASPKRVLKTATIDNWDMVQDVLNQQQGIIFLTPHLGCYEIVAQAIALKAPLVALYRPPRKKILRSLLAQARSRPNLMLAPANLTGVRIMLKSLKNGTSVGLLPDQVPQQGEGVWADFFNQSAYTMTLPSKLHSMTGAPIILSYAKRLSWGRGFTIHFVRYDDDDQLQTSEQQARAVNASMEKLIAQCPAQYMWGYNRYKKPATARANEEKKI